MIVVDDSAALAALLNAGPARRALADEQLHVPHLIDAEVAGGLASQGRRRADPRRSGGGRAACHMALAEFLECTLLTADARLSRAPGARCPITVVLR